MPFPKDVPRLKQLGVGGVITLNEPYETLVPTSLYYVSCFLDTFVFCQFPEFWGYCLCLALTILFSDNNSRVKFHEFILEMFCSLELICLPSWLFGWFCCNAHTEKIVLAILKIFFANIQVNLTMIIMIYMTFYHVAVFWIYFGLHCN